MGLSILLLANLLYAVSALTQFTPNQADWSTFYSKPNSLSAVIDHSPDGVTWISQSKWISWDGNVFKLQGLSNRQLEKKFCPTGDTVVGIRDLFYEHNPFADVNNPTKAEVDEWHLLCIRHVRNLAGITTPIEKDHCLFARALWAQERKNTRKWDADYPMNTCLGSTNPHCGAGFMPNAADQAPYLPPGHSSCKKPPGVEGVSGAPKSNIPWSIKWSRFFCAYLRQDGLTGHTGPFFSRTTFGWSFWDHNPNNHKSNAVVRDKWSGDKVTPNFS